MQNPLFRKFLAPNLTTRSLLSLTCIAAGHFFLFLLHLYLGRVLGPASYGTFVLVGTWFNLMHIAACAGFDIVLLQLLPVYIVESQFSTFRGLWRSANFLGMLVALGTGAAALITIYLAGSGASGDLFTCFVFVSCMLPLAVLISYRASLFQALKRPILSQVTAFLARPMAVLVVAMFMFSLLNVATTAANAILAMLIASLPVLLIAELLSRSMLPYSGEVTPEYQQSKWRTLAWPIVIVAVLNLALGSLDILMLGFIGNSSQLGTYGAASRICSFISMTATAVMTVASPTVAELHSQKERVRLEQLIVRCSAISIGASLAIAVVIVFARSLILGLFGSEFIEAAIYVLPIAAAQLVGTTFSVSSWTLILCGFQREAMKIGLGSLIIGAVIQASLIKSFDLWGAALGLACAWLIWGVWIYIEVQRKVGIRSGFWMLLTTRTAC